MKKLCLLALVGTCFISMLSSSLVYAESRAGAISATVGGGWMDFSSKRDLDNAGVPLVQLGYNITDHWGFEGIFGMFTTHSKNNQDTRRVDGTLVAVDGVYHFYPDKQVQPFLMAGPGAMSLSPSGNNAHSEGNLNAGAGLLMFIDKSVAFTVEARDFYSITSTYNDVYLDAGVSFFYDLC